MINKITIGNVTSYKEETYLKTVKKINLLYGLNGSGKTTISNYLYNLEDYEFQNCSIKGFNSDTQKILVYNQRFVKDNFYEEDVQKGIFTLAKENKEAQENITNAKNEKKKLLQNLGDEKTGINKNILDMEERIKVNLSDAQKKTWEIKKKYTGGDRIFDSAGFLDSLKSDKENLFNYIIKFSLPSTTRAIEDIKKEVQELGENETLRDKLQPLDISNLSKVEGDPISQEEIIGSQNSSIATLIEKLGNSDWVKQGLSYIKEKEDTCPFCQQDTLNTELKTNQGLL